MPPPLQTLVSDDACHINRQVFTDPGIYEMEQRHIFGHSWLYLAHESQFRKPGDFITTWMGETPVIVALGQDGKIHASINSCSHRGLPVCRHEQGNAKRFVCPYHTWSYTVEGELAAVPQERQMCKPLDKAKLGLAKVPRIESYKGLIFGSLDAGIRPLAEDLGHMRFYLDTYFDRFDGGVEVVGPPHKWLLDANWKMPVENQLGDVGHGPYLHGNLLGGSPVVGEIETFGFNSAPEQGHGASFRLFPEGTDPASIAWGMEINGLGNVDEDDKAFLLDLQAQAERRLGVGGRVKGLTYGVYPNFNLLWSNSCIRVSHPRGPGKVEYWTWWVVPKAAPDELRKRLRTTYNLLFGPAGLIEQEDSEAWTQQHVGSRIHALDEVPYYYGLGSGEEMQHPEVPGLLGNCYNELYAREFYKRWRRDIEQGERP